MVPRVPLSWSLKIIGTDTDRLGTYDFRLVISRTLCLTRTVSEISGDLGHVRLVSFCFGILRQIRSIRRSLPRSTLTMLISSFIMSKLDYCSVALVGLTRCNLDRLQSVINAAARLFSSNFAG